MGTNFGFLGMTDVYLGTRSERQWRIALRIAPIIRPCWGVPKNPTTNMDPATAELLRRFDAMAEFTATPGTRAPDASLTLPVRSPLTACADKRSTQQEIVSGNPYQKSRIHETGRPVQALDSYIGRNNAKMSEAGFNVAKRRSLFTAVPCSWRRGRVPHHQQRRNHAFVPQRGVLAFTHCVQQRVNGLLGQLASR